VKKRGPGLCRGKTEYRWKKKKKERESEGRGKKLIPWDRALGINALQEMPNRGEKKSERQVKGDENGNAAE